MNIVRALSTHSQRLDRWFGEPAMLESISKGAKGWYGHPLPIGNAPGAIYVRGDGDFVGPIRGGGFASYRDRMADAARKRAQRFARRQLSTAHTGGFSSLADLVTDRGVYRRQTCGFAINTTQPNTINVAISAYRQYVMPLWNGATPSAGGTLGTGRVCDQSVVGAIPFQQPASGEFTFLTSTAGMNQDASGGATWGWYGIYDRLWDMTYPQATAGTTSIDASNRPNRYATAPTAVGNFIGADCVTSTGATGRTETITYTSVGPSTGTQTANVETWNAGTTNQFFAVGHTTLWFWSLASGSTGVRYLESITQSATTTGTMCFFIGHMLGICPVLFPTNHFASDGQTNGINSAFNMTRVYDNACPAVFIVGAGQGAIQGWFEMVQG